MTTRLGVTFRPQLPPEQLFAVARVADSAGLDELWLWEDCFRESGIATAAAALASTARITVGIGLVPVPLRNVALTAMETATLGRLFPGRFALGIGHGVQDWMAQVGARVESPITLLREYAAALRALLAGETVTVTGRYVRLDNVTLDWPPAVPPRLLAGATGPKSLALCAEIGDSTLITSGRNPAALTELRDLLAGARAAAGLSTPHSITATIIVTTGPDATDRLLGELRSWDLPADESLGVAGDVDAIAAGIRRFVDAGADTIVVLPTADEPDLEGFIHLLGTQVRPLLQ